jgi:hypothetical protein
VSSSAGSPPDGRRSGRVRTSSNLSLPLPGRCVTFANNSDHALDVNSDAVAFAFAFLTYAYSTESVNGVPGKKVPGNFHIPTPAGPEGTFLP